MHIFGADKWSSFLCLKKLYESISFVAHFIIFEQNLAFCFQNPKPGLEAQVSENNVQLCAELSERSVTSGCCVCVDTHCLSTAGRGRGGVSGCCYGCYFIDR